ncbi:glucosaminidase domain-containing protein [Candidatus Saccharibacteria bacterium]|nr:glucosaminidase domain-containing protein [Candidatus Saccharibacteria bacterium]
MQLKRVTRKFAAVLAAVLLTIVALPAKPVEARPVSRAEQILFLKRIYGYTKEMGEKYQIPYQAGLATFCWESGYGTNGFARTYNNISGVGCYDDGICHPIGQYSSYEECIEAYFELLADNYKLRGAYGDPSAAIVAAANTGYNSHSGYASSVCGILSDVRRLEGEVIASLEVDAEAERQAEEQRKAEIMALLADETIMVIDAKADNPRLAGATAAMFPKLKEMTVGQAAQKMIKGKLGNGDERRVALGANYQRVQEYVQYITLPM